MTEPEEQILISAADAKEAAVHVERRAHTLDQGGDVDYDTLVSMRELAKRLETAAGVGPPGPRRQARVVYLSIYPDRVVVHPSREHADRFDLQSRIACIRRVIEFAEGDGL